MSKPSKADYAQALSTQFFHLGAQYYVAGRFALIARAVRVAPSLLHHAIELMLKGALASHMSAKQMRARGHELPSLWGSFKAEVAKGIDLSGCDLTITQLHAFEHIRYPERLILEGAEISYAKVGTELPRSTGGQLPAMPTYHLALESVDRLVYALFKHAHMNPAFFFTQLSQDGTRYLSMYNRYLDAASGAAT